jgi:hypothetical protein
VASAKGQLKRTSNIKEEGTVATIATIIAIYLNNACGFWFWWQNESRGLAPYLYSTHKLMGGSKKPGFMYISLPSTCLLES